MSVLFAMLWTLNGGAATLKALAITFLLMGVDMFIVIKLTEKLLPKIIEKEEGTR